ncbi:MAG: hypothetical protein ABL974_22610, partial [Prosthecobacter sp.]
VKRVRLQKSEEAIDWFADSAQGLYEIREWIVQDDLAPDRCMSRVAIRKERIGDLHRSVRI